MTSFISNDILQYLSRPLTHQEKLWIYDDFIAQRRNMFHRKKAEEYKNYESVGDELKFIHHTQEAERWAAKITPGVDMVSAPGPKANLVKPDLNKPAFLMNQGAADLIRSNKCPDCREDIHDEHFETEIQKKEYGISGKCVECQALAFPG